MNILVVGAGGREHSLVWKCRRSPLASVIHATPGNGGMETIANCWYLTDHQEIAAKAKQEKIDLVIIGQEDYLVEGLTELLEGEGVKVFGPSQTAARLEGSKVFSKEFMARNNIPSAQFQKFSDVERARSYLKTLAPPYVIKADGLAAGKGVLICSNLEEGEKGLKEIMVDKVFGDAGNQVVIEEFLEGEEASWFIFTDGKNHISLPSLQDHKRQMELDQGLNTGGMGCYAPAPVVTEEVEKIVARDIVAPTIEGMAAEGNPYKGILYIGLMINKGIPQVLEYNIRFGDPECQPLMMMLESDLVEIALGAATGDLGRIKPVWKNKASAIVVLASGGYPKSYEKGFVIQGLEEVEENDELMVFHAGSKRDGNRFLTNGGRVLGVTCVGDGLKEALDMAYDNVRKISWPGMQYRRDIGLKGLKKVGSQRKEKPQAAIIMGSASDKRVSEKAEKILNQFNIDCKVMVSSAHRTPERTRRLVRQAEKEGTEVFIAIAGMAAHLPGVIAAETELPVIGVPVNASAFQGQDALLSIAQMPPGIPVATVGIDRGDNAALLAAQILGLKYPEIKAFHQEYRLRMEGKVINDDLSLVPMS